MKKQFTKEQVVEKIRERFPDMKSIGGDILENAMGEDNLNDAIISAAFEQAMWDIPNGNPFDY
jgi:hypothetical protein